METILKLRQTVQDGIDYFALTEPDLKSDELYYITALIKYIDKLENAILEQEIENLEQYNERER